MISSNNNSKIKKDSITFYSPEGIQNDVTNSNRA
jgi:hypothetical protein